MYEHRFHPQLGVVLHGKQTLKHLRDALSCTGVHRLDEQRRLMAAQGGACLEMPTSSALLYIDGRFYVDGPIDLSEPIREWLDACSPGRQVEGSEIQRMDETPLSSLRIALGEQYLFAHLGDCEHPILFDSCWLATLEDEPDLSRYPRVVWQARSPAPSCAVCEHPAQCELIDDPLMDTFPCELCKTCADDFRSESGARPARGRTIPIPLNRRTAQTVMRGV